MSAIDITLRSFILFVCGFMYFVAYEVAKQAGGLIPWSTFAFFAAMFVTMTNEAAYQFARLWLRDLCPKTL